MLMNFIKQLAGTSGASPEEAEPLTIGGVPLLWSQEPLHLLLAGSTGTGKTTAVAELLDGITARGDRAVIVDPNGAYASMFCEPGDVILNPYDRRSPGWSPFSEVRRPYDFDKVSKSIVPDGHGPDAAWHFYAQTLVAEVLRALMREGKTSTAELVQALTRGEGVRSCLLPISRSSTIRGEARFLDCRMASCSLVHMCRCGACRRGSGGEDPDAPAVPTAEHCLRSPQGLSSDAR